MATAELVPVEPVEQNVVVTMTKREAALLLALSGNVSSGGDPANSELKAALRAPAAAYGWRQYWEGEQFADVETTTTADIKFKKLGA